MKKEEKYEVMKLVKDALEAAGKGPQKEYSKVMGRSFMIEFRILKYLANFRARYAKKKEIVRDRAASVLNRSVVMKTDGATKDDDYINQRGNIELAIDNYSGVGDINKCKLNAQKLPYNKYFMMFIDDIICWKKKVGAANNEGKVFLMNIEAIGSEKDVYFYFVISHSLLAH